MPDKTLIDKLVMVAIKVLQVFYRKLLPGETSDLPKPLPTSACFGFDRGTPVDRYYIEKFFKENGGLIRGDVLEVGDSTYSERFNCGEVASFGVLQHPGLGIGKASIIGDLADKDTLPADRFDCFICAQTFQYIFEVSKAIEGAHYLLKPGGMLLVTVPGISQISRYDADRYGEYWRFTTDSMVRLFQPVFSGGVKVESFGNVLSSTAFLRGLALEELPDRALLDVSDRDYPMIITLVARK